MDRVKRTLTPYLLVLPGGLWLLLFFAVPMATMLSLSLQEGDIVNGFVFTGHWQNYVDSISAYQTQLIRSLVYGAITSVVLIVLAFPVAYWIAFYGGRKKATYLFLILLPFFVSFVLRTISWRMLLTDDGVLLHPLKEAGLLPADFQVLGTATAVIAGLVYSFLPFMVLPIYVALERIDPRVVEAARDLYASPLTSFRKVIFPLALPGVFAGVLMTFVPATSDYVNSELLGSSETTMIGQVIQSQFLSNSDYPSASALSFTLMTVLLIGVFSYARALGTEDVMKVAAR
ncbi:spermidine/putrescine transport system permease protein [Actinoplanes campanulatus]|uniref:Spermidine/putrescine transport system permease protein n=1 Tax=Actinoplanes campanulatus TaxID=113559 RepID=A0A7W5AI11_9ACTN|nr:ABC transporter permease [Actinoplanes campanulatus]MBB3096646.1 spermidine/putrescine transport system permease protein [Actinoplanes campanulatus]GGN30414.1 ABC transporter permease [Actinoplanes campanulatus]GID37188.1 ABC transporter permease [Actinoplanes campanulatus]